jgi:hypothetical protein
MSVAQSDNATEPYLRGVRSLPLQRLPRGARRGGGGGGGGPAPRRLRGLAPGGEDIQAPSCIFASRFSTNARPEGRESDAHAGGYRGPRPRRGPGLGALELLEHLLLRADLRGRPGRPRHQVK